MKLPVVIESLDHLKEIAECRQVSGYIQLAGGLARSSYTFYYTEGLRRPWDVFHSMCDTWEEYTDRTIAEETSILEAIEKKALVIESIDDM